MRRHWSEISPEPEVIADRCVHSHMEQARCRACVDACPTGTWVLDDDRLGIKTDRCDGCGLCAPACPEAAIDASFRPARRHIDGLWVAYGACDRAGIQAPGTAGLMPCIHVMGVSELLRLHRAGVRRFLLAAGDCKLCPRGRVTGFGRSLDQVNALLADRGQELIEAQQLSAAGWSHAVEAANARHRPPTLGRRAFFRGILSSAMQTAAGLSEREEPGAPDFVPPGRLISGSGRIALHAPRIDPARCTGCDACGRLCPHDAIRIQPDAYVIDADDCTGCGICVDVCDMDAVSIHTMDASPQKRLPLHQRRCAACGADFHTPAPPAGQGEHCNICSGTPHHRLLFQVLSE
jgi:Pyruvate/2-oxoacid:ferredoxin oxidoreductase delta subunit